MTTMLKRLRRDRRGLAMTEFAFAAPLVLAVGVYGIEMSNFAIIKLQLSQVGLNVADNMSRVGLDNGLALVQITEANVNDSFVGGNIAASGMNLTTHGRIIISSLQVNASGGQWIAWQRCKGVKNVASDWGVEGTGATGTTFTGMGPATARVQAAPGTAVMYVEVTYDYQPLFPFVWGSSAESRTLGAKFLTSTRTLKTSGSYMVRDNRDLTRIYNPNNPITGQPAPVSACNVFSAT